MVTEHLPEDQQQQLKRSRNAALRGQGWQPLLSWGREAGELEGSPFFFVECKILVISCMRTNVAMKKATWMQFSGGSGAEPLSERKIFDVRKF